MGQADSRYVQQQIPAHVLQSQIARGPVPMFNQPATVTTQVRPMVSQTPQSIIQQRALQTLQTQQIQQIQQKQQTQQTQQPVVAPVVRPIVAPVPQISLVSRSKQGSNVAAPVTMAQLAGQQSFEDRYFVGGPEESEICSASVIFLLLIVIVIAIAIMVSSAEGVLYSKVATLAK